MEEKNLVREAKLTVKRGRDYLFSVQRDDFHWCMELESNCTITAEYVFMLRMLNLPLGSRSKSMARFFLNEQNGDGGWGLARHHKGDLSTTAEVYLALKILGLPSENAAMERAAAFILKNGGLSKTRIFTRIFFAMFGLIPWDSVPPISPEFIFLPSVLPVNLYALSSWARGTMVPLFVIYHHKPVFDLEREVESDHEWVARLWGAGETGKHDGAKEGFPFNRELNRKTLMEGVGAGMKAYEDAVKKLGLEKLRKAAVKNCLRWILEHQEPSGDWAGIFPPMINGILALYLEGYSLESEPIRRGLEAIEKFAWRDARGFRIQASVSPVWDTILSVIALIDAGENPGHAKLRGALKWLQERQILDDHGDWRVYRPHLSPGGWSFQYFNTWYPDIDDTAAALLAMIKQSPGALATESLWCAVQWILGMQNRDGGWGAFDVDNDKVYLNDLPFSDMESLADPSTPDVTGRVVEAFGLILEVNKKEKGKLPVEWKRRLRRSLRHALSYLRASQEKEGSWYGRWGVNYVYGTSNVLCGLKKARVGRRDAMVLKALQWLKRAQNADGGWGETVNSYKCKALMGVGPSTASQTAWALMGLLSYVPPQDPSVGAGIRWLVDHVQPAVSDVKSGPVPLAKGWTWKETHYTGTGFPKHFYLRYDLYRHYFPMMALGRYVKAAGG